MKKYQIDLNALDNSGVKVENISNEKEILHTIQFSNRSTTLEFKKYISWNINKIKEYQNEINLSK